MAETALRREQGQRTGLSEIATTTTKYQGVVSTILALVCERATSHASQDRKSWDFEDHRRFSATDIAARSMIAGCVLGLTAGLADAQTLPSSATQPLNPSQEIARESPDGPALVAGPTEIRIGGYLGVTGIYRSTNGGGGAATSFATIPYAGSAEGTLSEARLSAQSSRLSIRVNAAAAEDRASLAGYFEMDFNGTTPGNVAVTSTSVGFRLRNAFGEAQFNRRFNVAAGQAYTLMTPAKDIQLRYNLP
jgi:hypothetical protein